MAINGTNGRLYEMHQKVFEGVFSHVKAFALLFEMPETRITKFSVPFLFEK